MTKDSDVEMTQEEEASQDVSAITSTAAKMELSSNEVRKAVRETREDMQENRLDYVDPSSDRMENALSRLENILRSVTKPREAVAESTVLYELAVLAHERIKNVKCAFRSFSNPDFMNKLKDYMISFSGINTSRSSAADEEESVDHLEVDDAVDDQDSDMDENDENQTQSKPKTRRKINKRRSANTRTDYALTKPIIQKFGDEVMKYFRVLPRPCFLLGSLEKELVLTKTKKVRQQKLKSKEPLEAQRTKIKELDGNSKDNETSNTATETERVYEILKKLFNKLKGTPLCLYSFVVNPNSFSRTIENIFYISFLVKDGYAKIYLDDDNLPVIEPIQKEFSKADNQKSQQRKSVENIQSMISLTKPEWREIIEVFEISTPVIPEPKSK